MKEKIKNNTGNCLDKNKRTGKTSILIMLYITIMLTKIMPLMTIW
jgi:hypothetical protein